MADNFLEKHFQEYQARKASMGSAPHTSKKKVAPSKLKKSVLIAGGCSAIGASLVQAFCKEECKVAFCDADKERGLQLAKDTGSAFFHMDGNFSQEFEKTINALHTRWNGIDVLILDLVCTTHSCEVIASQWAALQSNLAEKSKGKRLILICPPHPADSQSYTPTQTCDSYMALTETLARRFKEQGITVNTICPEWIEESDANTQGMAHVCVFLSQELSKCLNGQLFKVE